jgi:hypothetical protein
MRLLTTESQRHREIEDQKILGQTRSLERRLDYIATAVRDFSNRLMKNGCHELHPSGLSLEHQVALPV